MKKHMREILLIASLLGVGAVFSTAVWLIEGSGVTIKSEVAKAECHLIESVDSLLGRDYTFRCV